MIQHEFHSHSEKAVLSACLHALSERGWLLGEIEQSRFVVAAVEGETLKYTCAVSINAGTVAFEVSDETYDVDEELIDEIETYLINSNEKELEKTYDDIIEEQQNALTSENAPSLSFDPIKTHLGTTIIVVLNILVFILMLINGTHIMEPSGEDLVKWGANFGPLIYEGEYWRLFTCCFVHIGIVHLLFNMYALFYVGLILEEIIGSVKFVLAYVITGIAASSISFIITDNQISAGASGAIFGLYGLFLAMLLFKSLSTQMVKAFLTSILVFVGYNLLYGLKDNIDNAAHIGGLVTGFIFGLAWIGRSYTEFKGKPRGVVFNSIALVILAGSLIAVTTAEPDVDEFALAVEEFAQLESEAMRIYQMDEQAQSDSLKIFMETIGIPKWKRAREVLENTDTTELEPSQLEFRTKLIHYVKLRERSYKILSDNADNPIWEYSPSYREFNDVMKEIEQILEELNA